MNIAVETDGQGITTAVAVTLMGLVFTLFQTVSAQALLEQPSRLIARQWTTDDGLPQNSVNAILQDTEGYLWIATFGGLARFDGVRFETLESADNPGLPNDRILTLASSDPGQLLVGTEQSGIAFFEKKKYTPFDPPDGLGIKGVNEIYRGPTGTLWIATAVDLLRLDISGEFTRFSGVDGLPDPPVYSLLEEADGTLWVGTHGGLAVLSQGSFKKITTNRSTVDLVRAIASASDGNIWIGAGSGLFRATVDHHLEQVTLPSSPKGTYAVRCLLTDRSGALWIGFEFGGLHLLASGRDHKIETVDASLPDNISTLFEDAEGSIWIGTAADGLFRLTHPRFISFGKPKSLLDIPTVPIVGDGQGGLWIGTNCNGLVHLTDGGMTQLGRDAGLNNLCVWSLLRTQNGDLWIGALAGELSRFDGSTLERFEVPDSSRKTVRALHEVADGEILVGTSSGAYRLNPQTTRFSPIEGTSDLGIYFITTSEDGALWLGTHSGLHILKGSDHRVWNRSNGLASDIVRAITLDPDGAAWIGTYGGGLYLLSIHHNPLRVSL